MNNKIVTVIRKHDEEINNLTQKSLDSSHVLLAVNARLMTMSKRNIDFAVRASDLLQDIKTYWMKSKKHPKNFIERIDSVLSTYLK